MARTLLLFFILLKIGNIQGVCPVGQYKCGSTDCYDPRIQGCLQGNASLACMSTCNGYCITSSQYCYNNTIQCTIGESVCNIQYPSNMHTFKRGLNCYNRTLYQCLNYSLCSTYYTCGNNCMSFDTGCANNQKLCYGFHYTNKNLQTCGTQGICYDNTTHNCLINRVVCLKNQSLLCNNYCMNPQLEICRNGTIHCIRSCNKTCYSPAQYCFNDSKICNIGEGACYNQNNNGIDRFPHGTTCYNQSQFVCSNGTLCYSHNSCGGICLNFFTACANNQTVCSGFHYQRQNLRTCGVTKACFDRATHHCINDTHVCENSQTRLCRNSCYNPELQICANGTIRCVNDCNGICASSSQYCYNNTKLCNIGESVCEHRTRRNTFSFRLRFYCFNQSEPLCSNGTLCNRDYTCGNYCLSFDTGCANNQKICPGFHYSKRNLLVCGPQQKCYDENVYACINDTLFCADHRKRLCRECCYDPETQICTNGTLRCIRSCRGLCFSNSQYCYNDTLICNQGELVCNNRNNYLLEYRYIGLHCYNSSQSLCANQSLCHLSNSCGNYCLLENTGCANNKTHCPGFSSKSTDLDTCGPDKKCYSNTTHHCLSEKVVCLKSETLCGTTCMDPNTQTCSNGTIRCVHSCNGTCYSDSQYCFNNTKICDIGFDVCDHQNIFRTSHSSNTRLDCYNASEFRCLNQTLCPVIYVCGDTCLTAFTGCAHGNVSCPGFFSSQRDLLTCGSQQKCYNNRTHRCLNKTIVCSKLETELCGGQCMNPQLQICNNGIIQCIRSCNGTCYSALQQCFNDRKICNHGEYVCDHQSSNRFQKFSVGLHCYNPSVYACLNKTLCRSIYTCGNVCLSYDNGCSKNQTLCPGFYPTATNLDICGSEQICYNNKTHICLNRTFVCLKERTQLCGNHCMNPEKEFCANNTIQCINSCNGTCYSRFEFCYEHQKICNTDENVCDHQNRNAITRMSYGLTCFNRSQFSCYNKTLCFSSHTCGNTCLSYDTACVNNHTICHGFFYWNRNVKICGRTNLCYDDRTSVCLGSSGIVCPIGNELCGNRCYDPSISRCIGNDSRIYCLQDPRLERCDRLSTPSPIMTSMTTTTTLSTSSSGACVLMNETYINNVSILCQSIRSCTNDVDCHESHSRVCRCHRRTPVDLEGYCHNILNSSHYDQYCLSRTVCLVDTDCCRCRCATIQCTEHNGNIISSQRCIR